MRLKVVLQWEERQYWKGMVSVSVLVSCPWPPCKSASITLSYRKPTRSISRAVFLGRKVRILQAGLYSL